MAISETILYGMCASQRLEEAAGALVSRSIGDRRPQSLELRRVLQRIAGSDVASSRLRVLSVNFQYRPTLHYFAQHYVSTQCVILCVTYAPYQYDVWYLLYSQLVLSTILTKLSHKMISTISELYFSFSYDALCTVRHCHLSQQV